jgi:8-oxo-dGTP pyrophosphatase MutT (NUDIX family)
VIALIEYVLCIARDSVGQFVFVEKMRPEWQKGKYNFPGGKLEPQDDDIQSAAQREFLEETGVNIAASDWQQIATLEGQGYVVYVMKTAQLAKRAKTQTDEIVKGFFEVNVMQFPYRFIENCGWLIALSLDASTNRRVIVKYD